MGDSVPNWIVGSVHSCLFLTVPLGFFCWKVTNYCLLSFYYLLFFMSASIADQKSVLSYGITEWLRLEGTSGGRLVQAHAQAGPPRASILARAGLYSCISWRSCAFLQDSYIKVLLLQMHRNQLCLLDLQLLLGLHHLVHISSGRPASKMGPVHQGNSHIGDFQELIYDN